MLARMPYLSDSRRILLAAVASVILALGLTNQALVHCSRLDPGHTLAASNYFEARGFPFAWLTSDDGTCGDLPGVPGRVLWKELGYSASVILVGTSLVLYLAYLAYDSR